MIEMRQLSKDMEKINQRMNSMDSDMKIMLSDSTRKQNQPLNQWKSKYTPQQLKAKKEFDTQWTLYDINLTRRAIEQDWATCARFDCIRDEILCFNTNPTDLSKDRSHPPCCSHLLRDMLLDIKPWLIKWKVEFWAHFGTLLGMVRDQTVFSWTADVDITIHLEHWEKICKNREARYELWELGYNFFDEGNKGERYMGRFCFHDNWRGGILSKWLKPLPKNTIYVDAYIYMDVYLGQMEKEGYRTFPIWNKWKPEHIWPLKLLEFSGNFFPVPAKSEEILTIYYGNWTVRLKESHGRGYKGYENI